MLFDNGKAMVAEMLGRCPEAEEWFAMVKKWDSGEMTIRQAAVYLGVGPCRVHHLCGSGELDRVRRGHVSVRSVEEYKARDRARCG